MRVSQENGAPPAAVQIADSSVAKLKPPDVLITHELASRPRRKPDLAAEASAFRELSVLMLASPGRAIQRFLDLALDLCAAGTAGLSLLEKDGAEAHFRWDSMAGALASHVGGTTPRDFSPCGLCLDVGRTILLRRPFQVFEYFNAAPEPLMEGLIVPLYDTGGSALGTLWVVHHDPARHFDAEDARVMEQLAVQLVLALKLRRHGAETQTMRREVQSLRAQNAGLIDEGAFLHGVLSSSNDCIKVLDLEGRLLFMSEGGFRVMEVDDFEPLRNQSWPGFWNGDGHHQAIRAVQAARKGEVGRFQGPACTTKGNPRFWDVRVTPILGDDGSPKQLLVISRDITDEHKAEEQRRLLSRELEHRIKNTLAMVVAIVNQTFRTTESNVDARHILLGRIMALNHAHDILTRASWSSAPIRTVVEGALAPHRSGKGRFHISGPDIALSARQSLSLSLALHELATNAAKYGALSNEAGTIDLAWTVAAEGGRSLFRLTWREKDGPPVVPPERRGFGSRLIERVLPADFGGDVRIDFAQRGVSCVLITPIENLQSGSRLTDLHRLPE